MTTQQLVGLIVRLFAVWTLLQAVQMLVFGLVPPNEMPGYVPITGAALLAIIAWLLWLFPMTVAHHLIAHADSGKTVSAPALEIATVACVVLGLWVLAADALPGISQFLGIAAVMLKDQRSVWSADWWYISSFVQGLVQLACALILMFKARPIASYLLRSRPAGSDAKE